MKIYKKCESCLNEMSAELHKKLELEFECLKCQRTKKYILVNAKYELLFDMGIIAYKNGFYREAVGNFSASLERFFEFSSWIMLDRMEMHRDVYNELWKEVRNQSERQYGFFISVYGLRYGKSFKLNSKMSEFRNKVVHKGEFPSKEESKNYAEYVYNKICDIYFDLVSDLSINYMSDYKIVGENQSAKSLNEALTDCFISNSIFFKDKIWSDEPLENRDEVISFDDRFSTYDLNKISLPLGIG